ncbi:MAG: TonB family protein [Pyrinomonadaceae bacterium]
MFEKMIESNSEGSEFKDRRSYFLVSSIVVGILFLSAVVFSIYAGEIGLGSDEIAISTLLAPVSEASEEPKPAHSRPQAAQSDAGKSPQRTSNTLRLDETPKVPDSVSVAQSSQMARPYDRFEIGHSNIDRAGNPEASGRAAGSSGETEGAALGQDTDEPDLKAKAVSPPPPTAAIKAHIPPNAPPVQSLGVVNGRAIELPKPNYPEHARSVGAQGNVDVAVTIDEHGNVISARAINGHPFLKIESEKAARKARFTPTYLSKVPVKVTGVIVYKFSRN